LSINQSYEEKKLLLRVANGDEKAFEMLVGQYGGLLHRFLVRITRDSFVADELVQDTFLRIWITREGLPFVNNFKSYLFKISQNYAVNLFKRTIRIKMSHHQWLADLPEDRIEDHDEDWRWHLFDQAVENLPPQQKKVWIMARHEKKKYHEIALELQLSKETVKKYLQFAATGIYKYIETHPELCLLLILIFFEL